MALLKLGPLAVDIRGSIGGTTYARNRGGVYARARTKPIIPISPKRDNRNALMAQVVSAWHSTLTLGERLAWTRAAATITIPNRLGEPYTPTGANLYVRSNISLLLTNQAMVTAAPTAPTAPGLAATVAWTGAVGLTITAIAGFDTALSGSILYQVAIAKRTSINFFKGPWDTLQVIPIAELIGLPLNVLGTAECLPGLRYFFRFRPVLADGAMGPATLTYADTPTPLT